MKIIEIIERHADLRELIYSAKTIREAIKKIKSLKKRKLEEAPQYFITVNNGVNRSTYYNTDGHSCVGKAW